MKVRIKEDTGGFKLPDDCHVPPGLRTPPDVTEDEIKAAKEVLMDYDVEHAQKALKKRQRDRKHGCR